MEKVRMRSIMRASILGLALAELGLEHEAVGERYFFARRQAGKNLGRTIVLAAGGDFARLEPFVAADKHHTLAFDGLQRRFWNDDAGRVRRDENFGRDEGTRFPTMRWVRKQGD